jgi:small-conductance mechanosensitive channel
MRETPTVWRRAALSSRFGFFGAFAKRIVERLIRFAIVRQDEINRRVDERLNDLEGAALTRGDAPLELRGQYAALSARLTHVQREIAPLRAELAELRRRLDAAGEAPE